MHSDANLVWYFLLFYYCVETVWKPVGMCNWISSHLGCVFGDGERGTVDVTLGHQCHKRANRCHQLSPRKVNYKFNTSHVNNIAQETFVYFRLDFPWTVGNENVMRYCHTFNTSTVSNLSHTTDICPAHPPRLVLLPPPSSPSLPPHWECPCCTDSNDTGWADMEARLTSKAHSDTSTPS